MLYLFYNEIETLTFPKQIFHCPDFIGGWFNLLNESGNIHFGIFLCEKLCSSALHGKAHSNAYSVPVKRNGEQC